MKTNIKKVTGSDKIPAKTEKVSEEQTNDQKSAMEQLIKDKTGDDLNVSKQISNMRIALNKNLKKTEKLTSKHTFAYSKVDRSRYITKK